MRNIKDTLNSVNMWISAGEQRVKALTPPKLVPLFALVVFAIFWGGLLSYTGTLNSGFHFIDDHEMVRIDADLDQKGFLPTISEWLQRDLGLRFRPFYYIHRVTSVQVFGTDFQALSLQNLGLAILTSWLLFMFVRRLGYSNVKSAVFSFMTLLGAQAAIWWRLGPNETIGMFCLSLSLFLLANSLFGTRYSRLQKVLSILFMVFASLTKEAFVAFIPAYLFLNWWLIQTKENISPIKAIWANIKTNVLLLIIMAIEAIFIFFVVGVNKIGYAGAGQETLNPKTLLATFNTLAEEGSLRIIGILLAASIVLVAIKALRSGLDKQKLQYSAKIFFYALCLFGLIVFPQVILYAKSGIYERYLVPGTLGFAFLFIFVWYWGQNLQNSKLAKYAITLLAFVLLMPVMRIDAKNAITAAKVFAVEGENINAALQTTISNSEPKDPIIVVAEPLYNFEEGYSLKAYITIAAKRPNIYFDVINLASGESDFEDALIGGFIQFLDAKQVDILEDKASAPVIFVFKTVEELFLEKSTWFDASNYERQAFEKYIVYSLKD